MTQFTGWSVVVSGSIIVVANPAMDNTTLIIVLTILLLLAALAVVVICILLVRGGYVTLPCRKAQRTATRLTNGDEGDTLQRPQVDDEPLTPPPISFDVASSRIQENGNASSPISDIPPSFKSGENVNNEGTTVYENESYSTLKPKHPMVHSSSGLMHQDNNNYKVPPSSSQPMRTGEEEPQFDGPPPANSTLVRHPTHAEPIYHKNTPYPAPNDTMGHQTVDDQSFVHPKPMQHEGGNQVPYDQLPPKPKALRPPMKDIVHDEQSQEDGYSTYDRVHHIPRPVYAETADYSIYDRPLPTPIPANAEDMNDTLYDKLPKTVRPVHAEVMNDSVYDRLPSNPIPVYAEEGNDTVYDRLPPTRPVVYTEEENYTVYDQVPITGRPVYFEEGSDTVYDRLPPTTRPVNAEERNDTVYDRLRAPTAEPVQAEEANESVYDRLPNTTRPI